MAVQQGELFVFYDVEVPGGSSGRAYHAEVHYARFDGTTWRSDLHFAGSAAEEAEIGTAVAYDGGLEVITTAPGTGDLVASSLGGSGGERTVIASGVWSTAPSAVVDPETNALHLFYFDMPNGRLWYVKRPPGERWGASVIVDGKGSQYGSQDAMMGGSLAAVMHSGPQVYYTDDTRHTLIGSWTDGTSWHPGVIDGAGTNRCNGAGATAHPLGGPLAVVQHGLGPHVYYADIARGNLREAAYY
jgi:hypothetical protein